MIDWTITPEDMSLVGRIVRRWEDMHMRGPEVRPFDRSGATMDLIACHNHGCKLDLQALVDADDFDFSHDVYGINRHLNRKTGELTDCFLPRFAAREAVSS